jgi:hypothetical protein
MSDLEDALAHTAALEAEIEELRAESDISDALLADAKAERDELVAALRDMIKISQRNSEATLMLIAIRKCAEHAIGKAQNRDLPTAEDVRGILKAEGRK